MILTNISLSKYLRLKIKYKILKVKVFVHLFQKVAGFGTESRELELAESGQSLRALNLRVRAKPEVLNVFDIYNYFQNILHFLSKMDILIISNFYTEG